MNSKTKEILYNIRRIRESKNLSQEAIAIELDLGTKAYSNIETGESSLTIDRLFKIAEILEVPVETIMSSSNNFTFNNCTQSGYFIVKPEFKNFTNEEMLKWCVEQIQQMQNTTQTPSKK